MSSFDDDHQDRLLMLEDYSMAGPGRPRKRKQSDITRKSRHLLHKIAHWNSVQYMVIVLLAFFADPERLELTHSALTSTLALDVYHSNETFYFDALRNREVIDSVSLTFRATDASMNGICAESTLEQLAEYQHRENAEPAVCSYTAYNIPMEFEKLTLAQKREVVMTEWRAARISGVKTETIQCRQGKVTLVEELCSSYMSAQDSCIESSFSRCITSKTVGTVGLLLYPIFFWYQSFSWMSLLLPCAWACLQLLFQTDVLNCHFYARVRLAKFVLGYSALVFFLQVVVFLVAVCSGNTVKELEKYMRKKKSK